MLGVARFAARPGARLGDGQQIARPLPSVGDIPNRWPKRPARDRG